MKRKAALILNGDYYEGDFRGEIVVCADAGYKMCLSKGIIPYAVVGDMDSLEGVEVEKSVRMVRFSSDKDQTDGELALRYLINIGYNHINIYGADGGRLDHVMGNVSLCYQAYKLGARASLKTNLCDMYFVTSPFEHVVKTGDVISIVPYSDKVHIINTKGLKYDIEDAVLKKGTTLGISNVATEENICVNIDDGEALIFRIFADKKA